MENSRVITFEVKPDLIARLLELGIEPEDRMLSEDQAHGIGMDTHLYLSFQRETCAHQLNQLVGEYHLEILCVSEITSGDRFEGLRIWARTEKWKYFRFNWRRCFQKEVEIDLCPRCNADVKRSENECPSCGAAIFFVSQGAILK